MGHRPAVLPQKCDTCGCVGRTRFTSNTMTIWWPFVSGWLICEILINYDTSTVLRDSLYMHMRLFPVGSISVENRPLLRSSQPFQEQSVEVEKVIKDGTKAYIAPWTWNETTREAGLVTFSPTCTAEQGRMSGEDIFQCHTTSFQWGDGIKSRYVTSSCYPHICTCFSSAMQCWAPKQCVM